MLENGKATINKSTGKLEDEVTEPTSEKAMEKQLRKKENANYLSKKTKTVISQHSKKQEVNIKV